MIGEYYLNIVISGKGVDRVQLIDDTQERGLELYHLLKEDIRKFNREVKKTLRKEQYV